MANSYIYFVPSTVTITTQPATIKSRIDIDPTINPSNLPVQSVVYNAPNIVVSFVNALTKPETDIVDWIATSVINNIVPGTYGSYRNVIRIPIRNVQNSSYIPTVQYDTYAGYNVGSVIYDDANNRVHVCLKSTINNAKWLTLTNSSLFTPLTFSTSFNSSNNTNGISTNSNNFVIATRFVYDGTAVAGPLNNFTCLVSTTNNRTIEILMRDRSNNNNQLVLMSWTNPGIDNYFTPYDLFTTTFTNLPIGRSALEILFRETSGGTVRIHSVQVR